MSIVFGLASFKNAVAGLHLTSVQYGDKAQGINPLNGLYEKGLHWVTNHRVQGLVKFTF